MFSSQAANAATTEITGPLTISATDITYDHQDLVVTGTTLTIDGVHTFSSITLNGSVLTHSTETANKPEITITGTISVDAGSKINLNSQGLLASAAVTNNSGGSYGGAGGVYSTGSSNAVFGNYQQPTDFGIGGHTASAYVRRGGGAIKIVAGSFILHGTLTANGGDANTTYNGGGGSGGSIWLDVGTLSGTGSIEAKGGSKGYTGGGGGGGRIAIHYTDISGFDISKIINHGGLGSTYDSGSPGTTYLKSKAATAGEVIVDIGAGPVYFHYNTLISIMGSRSFKLYRG